MARSLEFIAIGNQQDLGLPNLRCVPWVFEKTARALYKARLSAMRSCGADYMCFVDGGEDILLPGFVESMQYMADQDVPLGYADQLVNGKTRDIDTSYTPKKYMNDHSIIHHGVVCRTADLNAIDWPDGSYSWEVIAYGMLAKQGFAHDRVPRYDWRPQLTGARLWPTYGIAIISSKRFLNGLPEVKHR
jgi:hypothetical protein